MDTSDESSIEDWANTLRPAAAADTSALHVATHVGVSQQTLPIGFDGEDRVYWNEPDGIIIRKSEYGGILPKDWELNKDRLQGRFFFPDGNSLNPVPFYKLRFGLEPKVVDPAILLDYIATNRVVDASLLPATSATQKSKFHRSSDSSKRRLDRHLAVIFTRCNLPSSLVDHAGFREFLEESSSHYFTPCSKQEVEAQQGTLHLNLLEDLRMDCEQQGPNGHFAVAIDAWTCRPHSRLVTLNIFGIDSKWQQLKATAAIKVVPEHRTKEAIDATFRDAVFQFLGLPANRIISVSSNDGTGLPGLWPKSEAKPAVSFVTASDDTTGIIHTLLCPIQALQSIYKTAIYGESATLRITGSSIGAAAADAVPVAATAVGEEEGNATLRALLRKFSRLAAYLLLHTDAQDTLVNLCMDVDLPSQDFFSPNTPHVTLDCELAVLTTLFRFKPALLRGWGPQKDSIGGGIPSAAEFEVGKRFEEAYEIAPADWALAEQLIAVLARIDRFNMALGKAATVCVSKVYPELLALYYFMIDSGIPGGASCIPEIFSRCWEPAEVHPAMAALKANIAAGIVSRYPGIGLCGPLSGALGPQELGSLEPYLVAMVLDPTISNLFSFFANPSLSNEVNAVIVKSVSDAALVAVERAVLKLQSTWTSWGRHKGHIHSGSAHHPSSSGSGSSSSSAHAQAAGHGMAAVAVDACDGLDIAEAKCSDNDPLGTTDSGSAIEREVKAIFSAFCYAPTAGNAEAEEVARLRGAWAHSGGWHLHQKPPHLYWWELNCHRFVWASSLAAAYLAIPAATAGVEQYFASDGAITGAALADSELSDEKVEQLLFVRQAYHRGLLDTVEKVYKRKRVSGPGEAEEVLEPKAGPGAANFPLPHKPISSGGDFTANRVGDGATMTIKTRVMQPTGSDVVLPLEESGMDGGAGGGDSMPDLGDSIRASVCSQIKAALHALRVAAIFASHQYNVGDFRSIFDDLLVM